MGRRGGRPNETLDPLFVVNSVQIGRAFIRTQKNRVRFALEVQAVEVAFDREVDRTGGTAGEYAVFLEQSVTAAHGLALAHVQHIVDRRFLQKLRYDARPDARDVPRFWRRAEDHRTFGVN